MADSKPYSGLLVVIIFGVVSYYGFPSHLFGLVQVISVYFGVLLDGYMTLPGPSVPGRQFLDRHSNPNPIPNPVQELTVQELTVQEVSCN